MREVLLTLEPLELLALVLAVGLGVHVLLRACERSFAAWRRRCQARRASRGERRALRMLQRRGYVIEERQATRDWPVVCGQRQLSITLRADYLVRRGRQRFVAEVKTGNLVASIRHAPTRRQLLEYQLAYCVNGVLLVDVLADEVLSVSFPSLER